MKTLILTTLTLFIGFTFVNAQKISENAIGLRLGASDSFGLELSYQRALNANTRLEGDLGWKTNTDFNAFRLTGIYQWVWALDGNFNWYAGPGAGLASYNFKTSAINTETYVFIAGDVGIEYNFDSTLVLSVDVRPELSFGAINNPLEFDLAFSLRYQF